MPEVRFLVRWPDGKREEFYSPSRAIREHLAAGIEYGVGDFAGRCRAGLNAASERVRERYGYPCSSAAAELSAILERARAFEAEPGACVVVEGFVPPAAATVEERA